MSRMAVLTLAALLPSLCTVALAQDHAPSVEVCRADKNLWMSETTDYEQGQADSINKGVTNDTAVMKLTFTALNDRAREMGQCAVVDKDGEGGYLALLVALSSARNDRYKFFIVRHHLLRQMMSEDSLGRRHKQ